jgi:hypothetical protein
MKDKVERRRGGKGGEKGKLDFNGIGESGYERWRSRRVSIGGEKRRKVDGYGW